jgi:flagellar basal body-associated protein FliL
LKPCNERKNNGEEKNPCGNGCVYNSKGIEKGECEYICNDNYKNLNGICVELKSSNSEENNSKSESSNNLWVIITLIVILIVLGVVVVIIILLYAKKKKMNENKFSVLYDNEKEDIKEKKKNDKVMENIERMNDMYSNDELVSNGKSYSNSPEHSVKTSFKESFDLNDNENNNETRIITPGSCCENEKYYNSKNDN